ncbi:MAG: hypothetical protein Fur0014_13910 [Rubrivivax sp.]
MSEPSDQTSAQKAIGASALALVVAFASIVAFLPPMVEATVQSVPRTVLLGLAIATGVLLHWVFVGIAAHRLERSVPGWVALSVLLFPIGGIAALILLGFFGEEAARGPATSAP